MAKKSKKPVSEQGTKSDVADALAALEDEGWADTEETSFEIPKNKYQVKIEKAAVVKAKSSGNLQVAIEMTIVSGKYKGRKLWSYLGLQDEVRRGRTMGDLKKLGIKWPKSPKKLPRLLADELEGSYAEVRCSPKDDGDGVWTNFVRAIDEEDLEDTEEEVDLDDADAEEDEAEEAPKKPKKGDKKKPAADDDEEEEADDDEETDDADDEAEAEEDDDDEAEADDEEDEPEPKKPGKKPKKPVVEDDDEEESDDEDADDEQEAEDEETEALVEVEFSDDDIPDDIVGKVKLLAKKMKFKASDYSSTTDLLADMAEHVGLKGTFDEAAKLLKKVKAKLAEAE